MNKQRVLAIGEMPPKPGGAASIAALIFESQPIAREFLVTGLDITSSAYFAQADKSSVSLKSVARRLWVLCKIVIHVLRVRPSLIHYSVFADMSFLSDTLNLLVLKMLGQRLVVHYHNDPTSGYSLFPSMDRKSWRNRVFHVALRLSDLFIVLGNRYKESIESTFKVHNVAVLHNCAKSRPGGSVTRRNDKTGVFNALYLGRLSTLKGILDLLEVARMCQAEGLNVVFMVAGRSNSVEFEARVRGVVEKYDLRNVEMKGVVDGREKDLLLSSVDLLIFPSVYEAFGNAVIEAATYGVPSIVYNVGLMEEIVVDGQTGFIVGKHDAGKIFERLKYFYENRDMAVLFGKRAAERNAAKFSRDVFDQTLFEYYRRALSGSKPISLP